jgi:hypothetical protein
MVRRAPGKVLPVRRATGQGDRQKYAFIRKKLKSGATPPS